MHALNGHNLWPNLNAKPRDRPYHQVLCNFVMCLSKENRLCFFWGELGTFTNRLAVQFTFADETSAQQSKEHHNYHEAESIVS